MSRFWRVFAIWAAVVLFPWIMANFPRNGETLKSFRYWAGFPRTFASWEHDRLTSFDPLMLVAAQQ
jgi:hypothetical protein